LLTEFATAVAAWTLVPAAGGVFEVEVDDTLVYSKQATGRHPTGAELRAALRARMRPTRQNDRDPQP
jgi:selenoprotein W-related protein